MHIGWLGTLLLASVAYASTAAAQNRSIQAAGAAEFRISCAICHGQDARGDGLIAPQLKIKPADLTRISARNHGAFPFLRVFETIDGRAQVKAHGTREMPVWGDRYRTDVQRNYQFGSEIVRKAEIETVIRARILALIYYLRTIQQK